MVNEPNTRKITVKGGPTGAHLTELKIDDDSLLENAVGFEIRGSVDTMVEAVIYHRLIDLEVYLDAAIQRHDLVLQKTVWRTNPVDGQTAKTPHREYARVRVDTSLPDALRKMAEKIEEEEAAAEA
jgi:hypothetical protein